MPDSGNCLNPGRGAPSSQLTCMPNRKISFKDCQCFQSKEHNGGFGNGVYDTVIYKKHMYLVFRLTKAYVFVHNFWSLSTISGSQLPQFLEFPEW